MRNAPKESGIECFIASVRLPKVKESVSDQAILSVTETREKLEYM